MHPHKNKNWWRRLDPLTALLLLLLALGILAILVAALVHVRSGEREQNRTYYGARSAMTRSGWTSDFPVGGRGLVMDWITSTRYDQ